MIFAPTSTAAEATRRQSTTIPIVFATHGDPVGVGHLASLAHPGAKIKDLAQLQAEQNAEGMEWLQEVLPNMRQVAVLWNPKAPAHQPELMVSSWHKAQQQLADPGIKYRLPSMYGFDHEEMVGTSVDKKGNRYGLLLFPWHVTRCGPNLVVAP